MPNVSDNAGDGRVAPVVDDPSHEEPPVEVGRYGERVYVVAVAAFSGWVMLRSFQVGIGTMDRPGPGMWPFALAVLLCGLSIGMLFFRPQGERFTRSVIRPVTLAIMLFAFVLAYEYVGFLIPGIILSFYQLRVLGRESWLMSILISVLGTSVTYYLFSDLLGANMRLF